MQSPPRFLPALASFVLALLSLFGCSSPPEPALTGSVVVGLTSELRTPTDIQELHVVLRVNGAVVKDETRGGPSGTQPLSFPGELASGDLSEGDQVEVELEAFGGGQLRVLLIKRLASTEVVGGRKLLLHAHIDKECAPQNGVPVSCEAPETCVAGVCQASFIAPSALKEYSPSWSQGVSIDICKPPGAGAPIVIVGKGQSDYLPMDDYEVDQVEAGPQG